MIHTHKEHDSKSIELSVILFFIALAGSLIVTIWSLHMKSFEISDSTIGFISSGLVIVSLFVSFITTPILETFGKKKVFILSLIIPILLYLSLVLYRNLYFFVLIAGILTIGDTLRNATANSIFRDNTNKKELNEKEGLLFSLTNIGWLVGPLIAGYLVILSGVNLIFSITSCLFLIALVFLFFVHLKNTDRIYKKPHWSIKENLLKFIRNKETHLPYLMTCGLHAWWSLIYLYAPLFMIREGLGGKEIGVFMFFVVLPLITLEYFVGKSSEKRGLRKYFFYGFLGLSLISLVLFFVKGIYIQLILLAAASLFAALIEPLQDTFFFKKVSMRFEDKYFPVYKTAPRIGGFVIKFIIAGVLIFLPYHFVYLVMFLAMSVFAVLSLKIDKDLR